MVTGTDWFAFAVLLLVIAAAVVDALDNEE